MMSTRITAQLSRYGEVVISLVPSEDPMGGGRRRTHYDAWIYSKLMLPVPLGAATVGAGGIPPELGGLPLAGREDLDLTSRGYGDILGALYGGDDALRDLRTHILGGMSEGLTRLLLGGPSAAARRRIWWACRLPELEAIPWESIVLEPRRPPDLSFVRGSPGESVPPLPLAPEKPLRVAVIDPASAAPDALCAALDQLVPEIEVHWLEPKDPREALREAARAGFEVVHVIADGSAPLGLEGLLEFPEEGDAVLSQVHLRALLCGSRVTILALTPPEVPRVGPSGLPTVFHAFARLARGIDWGPTIVAEVGPMSARARRAYWTAFYRGLAASLDVEDAANRAAQPQAPVALFLRHRFGRQFARRACEPTVPDDRKAEEVSVDLAVSRDLLDAARALEAEYASRGITFPGHEMLEEERARQEKLASSLDDASLWGEEP